MPANNANIYVTVVRPGKLAEHVETAPDSSVEDILVKAGFEKSAYSTWAITSEQGDPLTLSSTLNESTQLIVGQKVDGA